MPSTHRKPFAPGQSQRPPKPTSHRESTASSRSSWKQVVSASVRATQSRQPQLVPGKGYALKLATGVGDTQIQFDVY